MSNPSKYIGKIVSGRFPYFDVKTNKKKYKARPLLVIGTEYDTLPCDFNVLPVSSISKQQHIDRNYDMELNEEQCNVLNLTRIPSYVRIHKQSTINSRDVSAKAISDFRLNCPDNYEQLQKVHREFNDTLFN